jgi:hypothetical protein
MDSPPLDEFSSFYHPSSPFTSSEQFTPQPDQRRPVTPRFQPKRQSLPIDFQLFNSEPSNSIDLSFMNVPSMSVPPNLLLDEDPFETPSSPRYD